MDGKLINKYCELSEGAQKAFSDIMNTNDFSVRVCHRMLKVARTIADMDNSPIIEDKHILEASAYKVVSRKYWGDEMYA